MDGLEKRKAIRVGCRLPARIGADGQWFDATVLDLSRTGTRLTIPLAMLGLEGSPTLLSLAGRLCEVLPSQASAEFDPQRLGSLIVRTVDVVRVGLTTGRAAAVELGCRFLDPLSEVDAAALGVNVPVGGRRVRVEPSPEPPPTPTNVAWRPDEAEQEFSGRMRRRFQAWFMPVDDWHVAPAEAWTEHLDAYGAVLRVPSWRDLPLEVKGEDVSHLLMALCKAYGPRVTVRIVDGDRPLWSGPALIRAAELSPSAADAMLVDLRFSRRLDADEMRSLLLL